ncbi:sigma-70 family RNA polymerase sigma factor [Paenibacillus sp. FSL E2-0178]|uniref:sigma-70 family RNA polymerase sigma factor n=1 Tax=Paenibacillus sp. FSL E2-0178 TaxID=2921361 RepID=UPI0031583368
MLEDDHSIDQKENNVIIDIERRFVSYISSMLHYNSINFDKKKRKYTDRFSLIFDEVSEMEDSYTEDEGSNENTFENLEDQISNPFIFAAFMSLTERERKILNLTMCQNLNDTEIAHQLGVTQQSISKTKKNAIRKLRNSMNMNGGLKNG